MRTCAVVIVAELFPEVAQVGAQIDGPQQPPLRANLPVVFQLRQRRQTDRLMAVQLSRGRHIRRRRVPREEIALRIIESGQFDRRLGPQRFEQFLRVPRLPSDETISVSRAATVSESPIMNEFWTSSSQRAVNQPISSYSAYVEYSFQM